MTKVYDSVYEGAAADGGPFDAQGVLRAQPFQAFRLSGGRAGVPFGLALDPGSGRVAARGHRPPSKSTPCAFAGRRLPFPQMAAHPALAAAVEQRRARGRLCPLAPPPRAPRLVVVACMEAPLEVERLLGVEPGGAYVLRNAGGVPSDDVIRSLCLAQRLLRIREVVVVHHSDCRVEHHADGCRAAAGLATAPEVFPDVDEDVRVAVARIERSPVLEVSASVRGLVFDDPSGGLREVTGSARERAA